MSLVRVLAVRVLRDAERDRRFVDEVLETVREGALSARDRAFLTHLVLGVTRRRRTLDWLLRKISGVREFDPQIHQILRVALYEIFVLRGAAHAAVDEAVEHAKKASARSAKFVNAVLRKAAAADLEALLPEDPGLRTSHPDWLVRRWRRFYGERLEEILEASNAVLPVTARVQLRRTSREALGLKPGNRPDSVILEGPPGESNAVREGLVTVQDETAMAVAPLVAGNRVVDLCASPGGKATHLAERGMAVVASDVTLEKVRLVRESARRLGVDLSFVVADGRRLAGRFDAVLLDAPCTNTGVLARRADARWRLREADVPAAAGLQRALLENAATLAPEIVYSTCSIEPEENESQIDAFLGGHRDWTCDHRELILPGPTAAGGFAARLRKRPHG